jgi:hypothetical protein
MGDIAMVVIAVVLVWIAWELSTPLASLLRKKGVLTQDELNEAMKQVGDLKGKLLKRGESN